VSGRRKVADSGTQFHINTHDKVVGERQQALPSNFFTSLLKTDRNPLLLKMKMDPAGHGGASGRYDRLHDQAFEYAWMLSQVGIKN